MRKKIAAIVLGFFAVLSTVSATAFADGWKEADTELLPMLGITTGTENDDSYVTRAELARYALSLINVTVDTAEEQSPLFADTEGDYVPYINEAKRYGLMLGRSETEFAPEEPCTHLEMLVVLLRATNYTGYAEALGGYDAGYIRFASDKGLIVGNMNDGVTHASAKKLLCRVLLMDAPDIRVTEGRITADTENDEKILERYFDIRLSEGRVVAAEDISITGYEKVGTDNIAVLTKDGVEVYESDAGMGILGYRVRAYVKETKDSDEVFYLKTLSDGVNELNLISDEITEVSADLESLVYSLSGVGRDKTARLSESTQFIYNGAATYGITADDVDVKNGNLTMIDVNLDKVYDIVHIWSYDAYIVDGKNTNTITVTDKVTKKIIDADVFYSDYETKIYKNGRECNFASINEWDILLVAETKEDPKKRTIVVSASIVEGKLQAIDEDCIVVDGTKLPVLSTVDKSDLHLEQNYLFALNLNGQVCIYKQHRNLQEYFAYMYWLYCDDSEKTYAKVLTQDNEYKVLEFTENFRVNGKRTDYESFKNQTSVDGYFVPQMAMVETNNEGLVRSIYVADGITEPSENQAKGLYQNFSADSFVYKSGAGSIGAFWLLGTDTKIFEIYEKDNNIDIEMSRVTPKNLFRLSDGVKPKVKIYNSGTNRVANVAVIHYNAGMPIFKDDNHTRQIVVVDCIEQKVYNGDVISVLKGTHLGQECEYRISPEAKNMEILKTGDCIYGSFNSDNVLYGYELRFSKEKKAEHNRFDYISAILFGDVNYTAEAAYGNIDNTRSGVLGTVQEKVKVGKNYAVVIKAIGSDKTYIYPTDAGSYVYTSSEKDGSPQPGSMENLDIGSRIYIAARYGIARDIFVFAD